MEKNTLNTSNQRAILTQEACTITVDELLHIMSTDTLAHVNMSALLNNHACAVAVITDAQILTYISRLKRELDVFNSVALRTREIARLTRLATTLRSMRDSFASAETIH